MHVNIDQLVDIAEGTVPEASAPHLAACEPCRAQVRELRAMMSATRDVDVPEPSPLFWDHLSSRVSAASVLVAAGLLIAVALGSRAPAPITAPAAVSVADASGPAELLRDVTSVDDPSLTLVASLTEDMDLETAREAGLAPRGSAEHAITHMSDGELRELGRLLTEAMARTGAI